MAKIKEGKINLMGVIASPIIETRITDEEFKACEDKITESMGVKRHERGGYIISVEYPTFEKDVLEGFNALTKEERDYYAMSEYITSEFRDKRRQDIRAGLGLIVSGSGNRELAKALKADPETRKMLLKKYRIKI